MKMRGDIMHYSIGSIVDGIVTGIQPYGVFVKLQGNYKGLIHISELSDQFVKDVHNYVDLNQQIKVKVLGFDECDSTHLKLSYKAVNHSRRNFQKKRKFNFPALPLNKIGFDSLASHLDQWIEDALQEGSLSE